jgi:glycerol-3-phosphate cytidylyltransferase
MIISLEKFPKLRNTILKDKRIVASSGYFDPLHPGHASYITESKKYGDILVVIVNGDKQCTTKKGKPFMPALDRARVVDHLKEVDYVIIYDHPTRLDSIEAIDIIRPNIFTKGGDRDNSKKVPEFELIESYGGKVKFNVGDPKMWSSSNYLEEWEAFINSQK